MMEIVADIECNGLNPDKIHCIVDSFCFASTNIKDMTFWAAKLGSDKYLIGHNFVRYDKVVLEDILQVKIKAKLVDTLALSWYLYPERNKHGLAEWGIEFGIPKPAIEDWDNLTKEEYLHRCSEDVRINTMLWERQKAYLTELYGVDGYWDLIEYLGFKMHCSMLQEQHKWKLNVIGAEELLLELTEKQQEAFNSLQGVMPEVQQYKKVRRPAKPFKMDRTLSAHGVRWKDTCEVHDIDFDSEDEYKVPSGFKPPNAGAPQQVKAWLFSLGWNPTTFKYVSDGEDENGRRKERAIPQVKKGDDLCPSIKKMVKKYPELKYLEELGVISHRKSLVVGFLKNVDEEGYVIAGIQGLTNTLRFKHAVCLNIPSTRAPYGREIRSLLQATPGNDLCGSDMSSLEDRTKQHYMMPHDPKYVADMNKKGFDPHLDIAIEAGFLTKLQANAYKAKDFNKDSEAFLSAQRHKGKTTNYASTYGAGAATIARGAEATLVEGKALHKAYWDRNWSIKAIADEQITKTLNGMMWLYNPVSKFWYELRSKKDIFSTLNQSTATYCFDMWVKEILRRPVRLVGQFHDEVVLDVAAHYRTGITKYLKSCVNQVNKNLKLNRDLDVDVDFGDNYSEIH